MLFFFLFFFKVSFYICYHCKTKCVHKYQQIIWNIFICSTIDKLFFKHQILVEQKECSKVRLTAPVLSRSTGLPDTVGKVGSLQVTVWKQAHYNELYSWPAAGSTWRPYGSRRSHPSEPPPCKWHMLLFSDRDFSSESEAFLLLTYQRSQPVSSQPPTTHSRS